MNNPDNSYQYQNFTPAYKPEVPETSHRDIFTFIAIFGASFVFSLCAAPFLIEDIAYSQKGNYIKLLCLCVIFITSLIYVKKENKASRLSTAFYALCSISIMLSYAVNGGKFYCAPAFLYLVGAMCVTKTGSLTQKRESYRYLSEELKDILGYPLKYCLLPIKAIFGKIHIKKNKKLGGTLLGCLFALPVIAVLFVLLSSGDAAFSNVTSTLTDFVSDFLGKLLDNYFENFITLGESTVSTLIFGTTIFSALFCFRYGIQKKAKAHSKKGEKIITDIIPQNAASGFFVLICLLYVFYLFSQLSYFFGAFSGKIPLAVNMTISEYARRGFFEMSTISLINLGLIALGVIFVKRSESGKIMPLFKAVFTFLCLFTELLIITAISKMALYITELGLTHKRILVCIIDILLFATVLCVLIKLYKSRFPYMKIIVSLCCAVLSLYTLIGDGMLIAVFNTNAYLRGYHEELDIATVCYEGDTYFAVKKLHEVVKAVPEKEIEIKYEIYYRLLYFSDSVALEECISKSTVKSFFDSYNLSDFLFLRYVRDNPEFAESCRSTYENYDCSYVYDEEAGTHINVYHKKDDPKYAYLYADDETYGYYDEYYE